MTTPPEARLFRISREESILVTSRDIGAAPPAAAPPAGGGASPAARNVRVEVRRRGAEAAAPPASRSADEGLLDSNISAEDLPDMGVSAADAGPDSEALAAAVAAVKAERLSPRQLRVAMRIARSHGITAASDEEAVARLRMRGIDPLHRSGLRKVVAEEGERAQAQPSPNERAIVRREAEAGPVALAPQTLPAPGRPAQLPSRETMTEERRAAEIRRIQQDIARRRRWRMFMLFARLAAFVLLPTLVAGWYYFTQATPLYATESQFQIQKSEGMATGSLGSIFSGTQLATNTDSVAVQSYLGSRDAMLRLDEELGFKRVFQDPSIDPLLRLPPDASNEDAYRIYKDVVKISYDPTEGVIGLEVAAPDPKLSENYSRALIRYAEGQVDQMTSRLREDQMTGASASYADAEKKVEEAQRRIQDLQQKLGVLDPVSENTVAMQQIATLETELTKKQLELGQLQANARPNPSRVAGVQGDLERLEKLIAERRAQLTQTLDNKDSLAAVTGELRIAEGDLQTRQQLLATAAAQLEAARIEANKQVRYLSLSVAPVPPDQPTYPKAWQNTLVALLIFAGIYLMLSLTASILREQVSS